MLPCDIMNLVPHKIKWSPIAFACDLADPLLCSFAHQIVQDDLLELYGKAITCAILGKAGPQRARVMTLLQKDERKEQLDKILSHFSSHVAILAKMYSNEIVRPVSFISSLSGGDPRQDDMRAFELTLAEHQKAVAADGFTLSQKAVIEHNLIAARRIYDNILFSELANLVGLDVKLTETVCVTPSFSHSKTLILCCCE